MDLKLFIVKSIFASNLIGEKGMLSFSTFNFKDRSSKVLHFPCSYKGSSHEAGFLSTSHGAISLAGKNKSRVQTSSYRYDGYRDTIPSIFFGEDEILDAFDDEYGGVIVNPEKLPIDRNVFASILQSSLLIWRTQGKKGIWLKLPVEKCELIPVAVKEGFKYHHAEAGYVMMTYWIPKEPCMLPPNASHQVGVGGFVMNHKNEVLVVQEKQCAAQFAGLWKLPTGFILEVNQSEEIFTGVVREVKEETGVDTEFLEVIAFRHAHNVAFEKSDLFFICMLRPISSEIKIDDLEVQAAKWMALREFVEQPLIKGDKMFKKIIDTCVGRKRRINNGKQNNCGLSVHQVVSKFDNSLSSLYYHNIS